MKAKTERTPIGFQVRIPLADVAGAVLSSLTYDELHELIVLLDKESADWGFTERLYKHFAKEMRKMPKEEREGADADRSA